MPSDQIAKKATSEQRSQIARLAMARNFTISCHFFTSISTCQNTDETMVCAVFSAGAECLQHRVVTLFPVPFQVHPDCVRGAVLG